eukprot:1859226-Alexandrium_andersonii.AAC.1
MNAYSGSTHQTITSRVRNNVYGWTAGGPAVNIEFLGGANCGYGEWLDALVKWASDNQGLLAPNPDTGCLRIPADRVTVVIVDDGHSLTGDNYAHGCTEPRHQRITAITEQIPKQRK